MRNNLIEFRWFHETTKMQIMPRRLHEVIPSAIRDVKNIWTYKWKIRSDRILRRNSHLSAQHKYKDEKKKKKKLTSLFASKTF